MKKKITDEDVGFFLGKVAEKIRSDMDLEFRLARSRMGIAENDLINSLNEEQKKLYDEFREKREEYYALASELYERKIKP